MAEVKGVPEVREQISLNGVWDGGVRVPVYGGEQFDREVYRRKVLVPASWEGKIIKILFTAVNFIADVYINGQFVMNHVGGWIPFSIDITDHVHAGSAFDLKLEVKGMLHKPVVDDKGYAQWPVGGALDGKYGGIADDVWMQAYGKVHVEDAYIQTSFRNKTITVDYTVLNLQDTPAKVKIVSSILPAGGTLPHKSLASDIIRLKPGERTVIRRCEKWEEPELWWPDQPRLYHLDTCVIDDHGVVDRETRRFGFREIWIDGNQFRLNGIRVNLYGDYTGFASSWYTPPAEYTPQTWPGTIRKMQRLNMRVMRWHMHPPPQYILDTADEMGLMIDCESPVYGRSHLLHANKEVYLENSKKWMAPWIQWNRNHPCIYMWGASNEMTYDQLGNFDRLRLLELGDTIRLYDRTRPVCHDGEGDIGDDVVNHHYPEGYNKEPVGSIYSWDKYVRPDKPTGSGEVLHAKSPELKVQAAAERNKWWLGIWTRGMRYVNFTDVRPACYWFASRDMDSVRTQNLKNAYAPVALFDKEYDDLGIAPFTEGILPRVEAGAVLQRTLILYNDECNDTQVTVEVMVKSGTETFAAGMKAFAVPLGEHMDISCSFQVPVIAGKIMELVLTTRKKGVVKFEETKCFSVTSSEVRGVTMQVVNIF